MAQLGGAALLLSTFSRPPKHSPQNSDPFPRPAPHLLSDLPSSKRIILFSPESQPVLTQGLFFSCSVAIIKDFACIYEMLLVRADKMSMLR